MSFSILGSEDIGATRVFGWIELDLERKDAAIGREKLVDAAVAATKKAGFDPRSGLDLP